MRVVVDILVQGLLLGGLYALFALGQSLMFGVMRLTNTAQGDFIVLGAFAAIAALTALGPLLPAPQLAPVLVASAETLCRRSSSPSACRS
jgi:branched-chain amino acid transport system permease protein